jgi:hypothetical protein
MARPRYANPTAGTVTAHALRLGLSPSSDPDADAAELVDKAQGNPDALLAALRRILGTPGGPDDVDPVRARALDLLHRALEQVTGADHALAG